MEPDAPEKAQYQALAGSLKELIRSHGWDSYRKLLEDAENGWIKRLLDENRDTYDHNKGVIEGLRLAFHLPQQIIDRASKL